MLSTTFLCYHVYYLSSMSDVYDANYLVFTVTDLRMKHPIVSLLE